MSLLKHIYAARKTSQNKNTRGWRDFDTWNLATLDFQTREKAEQAYKETRAIYDNIVLNQTWEGLTSQGESPTATEVAFRHHIWIDEHDDGFSLCVSFDKKAQTCDFMARTNSILGEMKFEHFTITQGLSDDINKYMTATHSVEVDFTGVETAKNFGESFEKAASPTAIYTDSIQKSDIDSTRYKAYFDSQSAAMEFAARTRNVEYRIREFPAAKQEQAQRFQIA